MKTIKQSLIFFFVLTVVVGGVYPAVIFGVSKVFFADKAAGGIVMYKNQNVGAHLIAQEFIGKNHFWGRPSAASYNASSSSASNYALTNADYKKAIDERKSQGLDYDLLTTSGSGLDPDITPAAAYLQVERVALARGLNPQVLNQLVKENIVGRQLGFLGEERVNVLTLNLKLENLAHE